MASDGQAAADEYFVAEQNARVIHNAERYYRRCYLGAVSSWNLRDEHMAATLANLASHLDQLRGRSKIVVWEHNSHVGAPVPLSSVRRASSTWASWCGPPGGGLPAVGFTTDHGRVTAASEWGGRPSENTCDPHSRAATRSSSTRHREKLLDVP